MALLHDYQIKIITDLLNNMGDMPPVNNSAVAEAILNVGIKLEAPLKSLDVFPMELPSEDYVEPTPKAQPKT